MTEFEKMYDEVQQNNKQLFDLDRRMSATQSSAMPVCKMPLKAKDRGRGIGSERI